MASASTSLSNCSKENSPGLGATSEWIVANSGHSRSQFMEIAVKLADNIKKEITVKEEDQFLCKFQLVSSLCDVITYYDSHSELSPSSELLLEVQELCIPIASKNEIFPLIEALLQHCHQERWEFPSSSDSFPTAPVCPLSPRFLQTVTQLQSGGYNCPSKLVLSYKSQVVLWTKYPPALEQELLDMTEACLACSEESLAYYVNARKLPKACAEFPKLYHFSESFLRELVNKSSDMSRVLHIFNQTVTKNKSSVPVVEAGRLLSRHIPCLHT